MLPKCRLSLVIWSSGRSEASFPVPNCEVQGVPPFWFGDITETEATRPNPGRALFLGL
jgi:hypothetical protein